MMDEDNKARSNRIKTNLPLNWRASFESRFYNISLGGLYFRTNNPPTEGKTIDLDFTLPDGGQRVQCCGLVRWTSSHSSEGASAAEYGVGIEFVDLNDDGKSAITHFIGLGKQESRLKRRVQIRLVVEYQFAGQSYRTVANDLSGHGMFLVSAEPLQLDDMVSLRFELPDTNAIIKVRGIVRWRHDSIPEDLSVIISPGMGIEFTDAAKEDLILIEQFVEQQNVS